MNDSDQLKFKRILGHLNLDTNNFPIIYFKNIEGYKNLKNLLKRFSDSTNEDYLFRLIRIFNKDIEFPTELLDKYKKLYNNYKKSYDNKYFSK